MSPIRILILAFLLYVGYLLIKGGRKKSEDDQNDTLDGPESGSDILVECPTCKKLVPKQQAITMEHENETLYFCSQECCDTFVSEKGAEE